MERSNLKRVLIQFPAWLIEKFKSFRWRNWAIYCVLLFFVGTVINHVTQYRFPHFITHQLLLIIATTLLVCAMKMFFLDIDKLIAAFHLEAVFHLPLVGTEFHGLSQIFGGNENGGILTVAL